MKYITVMTTYGYSYKDFSPSSGESEVFSDIPSEGQPQASFSYYNKEFSSRPPLEDSAPYPFQKTYRVFVGGLSVYTNEVQLRACFERFGDLHTIRLVKYRDTDRSQGFAFIDFKEHHSAENAVKWSSKFTPILDGRRITINWAERRRRSDHDESLVESSSEKADKRARPITEFRLAEEERGCTWEYIWVQDDSELELLDYEEYTKYGPYSSAQMAEWKNNGFFNYGRVLVRRIEEDSLTEFIDIQEIDFDLFP